MSKSFRSFFLTALLLAAALDTAFAGPPPSCASKFVGTWVYPGGVTTVSPNGLAYPHCPMCVPVQTWTCQGNTFLFSNSGPPGEFSATMIDINHMRGTTGIATRVGGAAIAARPTPDQQAAAASSSTPKPQPKSAAQQQKPPPTKSAAQSPPPPAALAAHQQSADCSTITGLGSGSSGPSNCQPSTGVPPNIQAQISQAQSSMQTARTVQQSDPSYNGWTTAAAQFRKAAAAFQAAGDLAQAAAAAEQAQTLESALKIADQKAGQGLAASRSPASTQQAPPASGQTAPTDLCETLHSNADQCYRHATDMGPGGGPIPASGQAGAFLECVRVYCSAMLKAKCPMPIFGTKRSLGYCFTLATDDPDFVRQRSLACPPGKHLFLTPNADEPICQDNANGSADPQPGPNSTITGGE